MKVLLVGRWGKTHALAKSLAENKDVELFAFMDKKNNGISEISDHFELGDITSIDEIEKIVTAHKIEFIVIVPEMTLNEGAVDYFSKKGIPCFGPSKFCTKLEGDKGFVRDLMKEHGINAYPEYKVFHDKKEALDFLKVCDYPVAVKPAGITEGDGVKVEGIQLGDRKEAMEYTSEIFDDTIGGLPSVIIEEKIEGEEYTLQILCDGQNMVPLPAVRDYKLLHEGDSGLNTPGMGSYSSANHLLPFLSRKEFDESMDIIGKILNVLKEKYNEKYKGFLSGQFMLTEKGIQLVEINVRPGDSEILNSTPVLMTDLFEICKAVVNEKLDELDILCWSKATVCKYVVPEGFPTPKGTVEITFDRKKLEDPDIHLFQSCFEDGKDIYQPSPRLFAVTGVGNTLEEAYEKCEKGISGIKGKGIFHRKDIGTPELTGKYRKYEFLAPVEEKQKPQILKD